MRIGRWLPGTEGVTKIADDLCLKSKISMFRQCNIDEGKISSRERANDAIYVDVFSRLVWLRRLQGMRENGAEYCRATLVAIREIWIYNVEAIAKFWWVIRSWVRIV